MPNTRETVSDIVSALDERGVHCEIFGGWAEEILGIRPAWTLSDIDLALRDESLTLLDAAMESLRDEVSEVAAKRFRHKRAFIFRDTLCEIIWVKDENQRPVTHYWGDVPFYWERPFLHREALTLHGRPHTIVSADNLRKHREQRKSTQPHRWQDPASLDLSKRY